MKPPGPRGPGRAGRPAVLGKDVQVDRGRLLVLSGVLSGVRAGISA
ncbi:MAG: hypothetical protein OEN23_12765 [Paracoccaceae bacterium]|nr:hypothetical protein [Paracoccaceae bacterium]